MAKQLIAFNPIFTPGTAGAGTLDFTGMEPAFHLDDLYAVVNVTRNVILYAPGVPTAGYTTNTTSATTGKIVYLAADTSSYAATDQLNVFYDVAPGAQGPSGSNVTMERGGFQEANYIILSQILNELKVMNLLIQQGMLSGVSGLEGLMDLDMLRNDMLTPATYTDNAGLG